MIMHTDQALSMRKTRRQALLRNISARRISSLKICLLTALLILIAMGLTLSSTAPVLASPSNNKDESSPTPTPLTPIDATKASLRDSRTYEIKFDGPNRYQALFEITGDRNTWRYIKFTQIPAGVSINVNGQPPGYEKINDEVINPNKWYSFKNRLPLILTVQPTAKPPLVLTYDLGISAAPPDTITPEQARASADADINIAAPVQTIKLNWTSPVVEASPSPTVSPTPSPSPQESNLISLLSDIPLGIKILLGAIGAIFILLIVMVIVARRKEEKQPIQSANTLLPREDPFQPPPSGSEYAFLLSTTGEVGQEQKQRKSHQVRKSEMAKKPGWWARLRGRKSVSREDEIIEEERARGAAQIREEMAQREARQREEQHKREEAASPNQAALSSQDSSSSQAGVTQMTERSRDASHATSHREDATSPTGKTSTSTADSQSLKQEIDRRLRQLQQQLEGHISKANADMMGSFGRTIGELKQSIDEQKGLRSDLESKVRSLKDELENNVQERFRTVNERISTEFIGQQDSMAKNNEAIQEYVLELEKQVESRFKSLSDTLERQQEQDTFYTKMLGFILGQNIETLRADNFDGLIQEAGASLNRFFQEDIPRPGGLPQLQQKAEAIRTTLKAAVEQMCAVRPEVDGKLSPYVEKASSLVEEFKQLTAQLQSRQLNLAAQLQIPVSAYGGARDSFLQELGQAIKREVDKLRDPQRYCAQQLERFATSDVMKVADICDLEVTGAPGKDQVLEERLKSLFKEAGLRSILPQPDEPFRPAQQNLIQMVTGQSSKSQKIAGVVRRGFYYLNNGEEKLLRKAGVNVYR